ncbi:MAG TPA: class I SAM-dependent methyltransferase [Candidatus Sulfotelmatobacter sp.]|jgi:hypothetical protein|nr:class I SAM-dependent methyltransferase [Candidatus Sulfotelmatobacter sp.]
MPPGLDRGAWFRTLEGRYLTDLTFPEVRRALTALSSVYVERRAALDRGADLDTRGKRAAFALFFGPLHLLAVDRIVEALGAAVPPLRRIVDLGCGTGTAGAAWALACGPSTSVEGVDASGWAVAEAAWTYGSLGVRGTAKRGDLLRAPVGAPGEGVLAAYAINELDDAGRSTMGARLLAAHRAGSRVLVVEPIARRPFPWWPAWSAALRAGGAREDEWRFAAELPERMRLLDRAAGLDHAVLTARSLWL